MPTFHLLMGRCVAEGSTPMAFSQCRKPDSQLLLSAVHCATRHTSSACAYSANCASTGVWRAPPGASQLSQTRILVPICAVPKPCQAQTGGQAGM